MPHQRFRQAEQIIQKMASFWPVIGVQGLRQVGKSTLLRDRLDIPNYLTFDDDDTRSEADASIKSFLARHAGQPTVIDEAQKVPKLFDAIKAHVDRNRRPGRWYLSGSVAFSQKLGIRESLTGRIGLLHLYPMCLAELKQKSFFGKKTDPVHNRELRFSSEDIAAQMELGGLPVPAFLRDESVRNQYWQGWLETTITRDAGRAFGRGFDPEYCLSVITSLARALPEGEYPSLAFIKGDKRKAKKYITALQDIFLLRRFTVDESGVGNDHWIFGDSGLAAALMQRKNGEGAHLSLARHSILNEIFCYCEYQGYHLPRIYFKSARGSVVDLVWNNIPIRIVGEPASTNNLGYAERALAGALEKLGSDRALLVAPVSSPDLQKKGISVVPWSYWS